MPSGIYKRKPREVKPYRVCAICKETKKLTDFRLAYRKKTGGYYRHSYCNQCLEVDLKEYNIKRRAKHRLYIRKKYKENPRQHQEWCKKWTKKYPEMVKAQREVAKAINKRLLKRLPCEICGKTKVHAHHPDYSKPLSVRWLCSVHHKAEHLKLKLCHQKN